MRRPYADRLWRSPMPHGRAHETLAPANQSRGERRMSATLPSGLSEGSLDAALEEFRAALGEEAVITDEAAVREFRDPFWPADDDTYAPSVIVMPETTEQVQDIVRIANRHAVPVWTHSTGRNNGYGGPAPRVGGSRAITPRHTKRRLPHKNEAR